MGTVNYTRTQFAGGNQIVVTWASMSSSSGTLDTGQTYPSSLDYGWGGWLFGDKTVQVFPLSSLAVDAQCLIEGSNVPNIVDPTALTYATLTDAQGNALLFTNATMRLEQMLENPLWIRPRMSTVSSTSMAVTVHMLLTSSRSQRSGM